MKVLYCGFNLYHQFNKSPDFIVKNFTESIYEDGLDIIFSHTFSLVILEKSEVMYHGSKHKKFILHEAEEFKINQVTCTDKIIISLNKDGVLFRLDVTDFTAKPLLQHIKDKFVKIACGSKITVALTQEGEIYNLPNKLNYVNKDIIDLAAGCEHSLLLSRGGDVYSFGCGSRGQLGHGSLENEAEPKLLKALSGIKISKIAAGGWHSCAISAEGDLYIWGWNSNGQLGLFNDESSAISVFALPQVVDIADTSENVIKVACGNRHTVVLLDNGKVFGAGWNKYYQLGSVKDIKTENVYKMIFLGDFSYVLPDVTKLHLKCGPWSTGIISY